MTKSVYVGVGDKAKKVKKVYVGVGDKAKKVKKGYIGINGIAKLIYSVFSAEKIADIDVGFSNYLGVAGSVGKLVYFCNQSTRGNVDGTCYGSNHPTQVFFKLPSYKDISDDGRPCGRSYATVANAGEYSIISVGYDESYILEMGLIEGLAYKENGTVTRIYFYCSRQKLAGASVGNSALFAGGSDYEVSTDLVEIVNKNLSFGAKLRISTSTDKIAGQSLANHAIFFQPTAVDAFNESFVKTSLKIPDNITKAVDKGAKAGENALFFSPDYIYAYNGNLVLLTPYKESANGYRSSTTTVTTNNESYAILAGGLDKDALPHTGGKALTQVCLFDGSLAKSYLPPMNKANYSFPATSCEDTAYIGGGESRLMESVTSVKLYKIMN